MKNLTQVSLSTRQQGESLIGVMVGMVLSMMAVLMMLATFKVSVTSTSQASQDAIADAQIISGILRAGMLAQDAGSFVPGAKYPDHIHVNTNANFTGGQFTFDSAQVPLGSSGTAFGNAIIWRTSSVTPDQCTALIFLRGTDGSGNLSQLPTIPCPGGGATYLTWPGSLISLANWPASKDAAGIDTTPMVSFALDDNGGTPCSPFGQTAFKGTLSLIVTTTNRSGQTLQERTCLTNFHPSSYTAPGPG